ncbi:hypothetical protein GGI09_004566 [Coemansia sp. S100]|nr:hypothetical protein LPJ71_001467 [Coemansia sp. S17]KAJ2096036.1 hypothetical protein GGI09_004566 [Coemansia sp. S100]
MITYIISTFALAAMYTTAVTAAALPHQPADTHLEARDALAVPRAALTKRCGSCGGYGGCGCGCGGYGGYGGYGSYGGYGGYGGYGYPFVSSFTSDFDRNSNRANFNENTLYANNVNANAASDNVHAFTNANVIA